MHECYGGKETFSVWKQGVLKSLILDEFWECSQNLSDATPEAQMGAVLKYGSANKLRYRSCSHEHLRNSSRTTTTPPNSTWVHYWITVASERMVDLDHTVSSSLASRASICLSLLNQEKSLSSLFEFRAFLVG